MIPYGRQDISAADVEAVVEVLHSDFLTQGPAVTRFENAMAAYCGVAHAVAMNSATSALHVACRSLGLGPGDSLWTSPISFVASSNCALYCSARVDFVDIDPLTGNLCIEALSRKLHQAREAGSLPKVLVPVHLAGLPCDMQAIYRLSQEFGFRILEDASHAVGARYHDQPVGGCEYSDITVFSFHPVKIMTSAEGGMALTRNPELAEKMRLLSSHGVTRDPGLMTHEPDGPWYYQQVDLGYNYRMTDLQAALGYSQLQRLDLFVERRNALAARYDGLLAGLPVRTPVHPDECYSSFHLYIVRLNSSAISVSHKQVFCAMRDRGVGVNLHYIPIHTQPYYQQLGFCRGGYPEAERYYCEAVSLPLYPGLSESDQDQVVAALRESLEVA